MAPVCLDYPGCVIWLFWFLLAENSAANSGANNGKDVVQKPQTNGKTTQQETYLNWTLTTLMGQTILNVPNLLRLPSLVKESLCMLVKK